MEAGARTRQPFSAHIHELRRRLLWSVALLFVGGGVGYFYREPLIRLLQHPLGQPLFYNSPAGAFEFSMKISLLVGLILAIPAVLYNLVRFIEPALKSRLRTPQLVTLVCMSFALAVGGLAFAYYIVLPISLHFFADFSSAQIKPLISAKDYLSFVIACLTTFVVMFQIPLLLLFIDRITPLPPRKLRHYRRHVIVGSLIIAVILPFTYDPITQFVIAIPIIVLYELSIILIVLAHRRRARQERQKAFAPATSSVMPEQPIDESPAVTQAVNRGGSWLDLRGNNPQRPQPKTISPNVLDLRKSQ